MQPVGDMSLSVPASRSLVALAPCVTLEVLTRNFHKYFVQSKVIPILNTTNFFKQRGICLRVQQRALGIVELGGWLPEGENHGAHTMFCRN